MRYLRRYITVLGNVAAPCSPEIDLFMYDRCILVYLSIDIVGGTIVRCINDTMPRLQLPAEQRHGSYFVQYMLNEIQSAVHRSTYLVLPRCLHRYLRIRYAVNS